MPVLGSPTVANGLVFVGAGSEFSAFPTSCTGTCSPRWTYPNRGGIGGPPFNSSPAVANGVVYVGQQQVGSGSATSDYFSALSATTGSLLWTGTTGSIGRSSPAVANGVVYIGDQNGILYAFPASCGTTGATCSPLWTTTAGTSINASPAVANGMVYIGSGGDGDLHAYNLGSAQAQAAKTAKPAAATLKPNYSLKPQ